MYEGEDGRAAEETIPRRIIKKTKQRFPLA
jgi:hypothetical protein